MNNVNKTWFCPSLNLFLVPSLCCLHSQKTLSFMIACSTLKKGESLLLTAPEIIHKFNIITYNASGAHPWNNHDCQGNVTQCLGPHALSEAAHGAFSWESWEVGVEKKQTFKTELLMNEDEIFLHILKWNYLLFLSLLSHICITFIFHILFFNVY